MSEREKKEEFRRSDIDKIARPAIKLAIVICLPWILISKLDKQFDRDSEEKFSWWNFYWSFPATHLSWLVLTVLFELPLWGLIGAPLILLACVVASVIGVSLFAGITHVSLSRSIIGAIILAVIWLGLYFGVKRYRSLREISEVRREVFSNEGERGDLNEE